MDTKKSNCRKAYFRKYYLENKKKYIKEKEKTDAPPKKRGRPKKVIPPFTITYGTFVVSFD